jgi:hypothetical protein
VDSLSFHLVQISPVRSRSAWIRVEFHNEWSLRYGH